ncbi:MAG: nodulation S family protein [Microlunatus sp.]|nr:nodulation S family protein [Microlunatus sp.]MDN5804526.1 nodulation S family protein [Microlunatus sp.]
MVEVPDFDALYRSDPDPWQVGSSFYEQRKLGVVLACLTRSVYPLAWDPACGTGELAAGLAGRCDLVLATDASPEAVQLTATRCADLAVTVAPLRQPSAPRWPPGVAGPGRLALAVVAEFAYYLPAADRSQFWVLLDAIAAPEGEIAVVHWRHQPHDGFLSGADVNAEAVGWLTEAGWSAAVRHDDRDFVLDVLIRATT